MNLKNLLATVAVCLGLFSSASALAHTHLKTLVPAADSSVAPTSELRMSFSEALEVSVSQVQLLRVDGAAVGPVVLGLAEDDNKTLLVKTAQPLAPGEYQVQWRVVSKDTHTVKGTYRFKIRQ